MTPATIETVEALDLNRAMAMAEADRRPGDGWTWEDIAKSQRDVLILRARVSRLSDERAGLATEAAARVKAMEVVVKAASGLWGDPPYDGHIIAIRRALSAIDAASPFAQPPGKE